MRVQFLTLLTSVFCVATAAQAKPEEKISPDTIIQRVDEIRSPKEDFKMMIEVKNNDGDLSTFEVFTKGKDKTLIKTLTPDRDKGRNMLMLGENMWAFIPNLKRTVRISLSQKLMGEAANGDISRMKWSGDYDAKIEKDEATIWQLLLTAQKKGLTYDKLIVNVEKNTFHPLSADYLTKSGDVLKHVTYKAYKDIGGGSRPTEILIEDAMRKNISSLITIKSITQTTLSEAIFNQNALN